MGSAIIVLALLSMQAVAGPCEDEVKKNHQPLTFEMIEQAIPQNDSGMDLVSLPRKKLESFWHQTWPKIKERASEQSSTVGDVAEEYFALAQSLVEDDPTASDSRSSSNISVSRVQLHFLEQLERVPLQANLRNRDWYLVSHTYTAFWNLGLFAIRLEPMYREMPSFNPRSTLTDKQILKIFESIENASLDLATRLIDIRRQQFDPMRSIRLALNPIMGAPDSQDHQITVVPPETQLALVLNDRLPLKPDFKYRLHNSSEEDFTVTLAPELSVDEKNSSFEPVYKLLRGLVGRDRFKNRVKNLFDVAPYIVEVRNILAGDKRLLGCLEGNDLRLIKLGPINQPVPTDLCK